jgi:hypothetical protein
MTDTLVALIKLAAPISIAPAMEPPNSMARRGDFLFLSIFFKALW